MRMNKGFWIAIVFAALAGIGWTACGKKSSAPGAAPAGQHVKYRCPMHTQYISDKPGECPICHMTLVPFEESSGSSNAPAEPRKLLYYRNPMRPDVTSPVPAKDEMGMDYVPVYSDETSTSSVPGQGMVAVSSAGRRLIGLQTEEVAERELNRVVRTSARVAYDPDLYNAIAEYQEAIRSKEKVKDSPWQDAQERSQALVRAASLKLRQLGLSDRQIRNLAQSKDRTNLLLPEQQGTAWVYAQIFENEIGLVHPGQTIEVTTPAIPGRKFRGKVQSVDTILDSASRSLKCRAEVENPSGVLKPEMYVDARILVDIGKKLAVPLSAVLNTGERQLVFVDQGNGSYEPREVRLGNEAEDYAEVISGVKAGEKVVTSANFLIDSESKLKAALGGKK